MNKETLEELWEQVIENNTNCLEDYQTELVNLTVEQAEDFLSSTYLSINEDECYLDGTLTHLSFGEEGSAGEYMHIVIDSRYGGAITLMEYGSGC